jgi:hypothetical protein
LPLDTAIDLMDRAMVDGRERPDDRFERNRRGNITCAEYGLPGAEGATFAGGVGIVEVEMRRDGRLRQHQHSQNDCCPDKVWKSRSTHRPDASSAIERPKEPFQAHARAFSSTSTPAPVFDTGTW